MLLVNLCHCLIIEYWSFGHWSQRKKITFKHFNKMPLEMPPKHKKYTRYMIYS